MAYAERDRLIDPASLPAGSLVGSLVGWLWPLNYLLFCLILLLFPDGRLPSPRWRPAARFILVAWGASILLNPLAPTDGNRLSVPALGRPAGQLLLLVVNAAALAGLVIAAAAPFLRFRRAGYQQRQQLKWVAFTVAVSVLSVLVSLGLDELFPAVPVIGLLGLLSAVGVVVGFPVAVAVAILRHRLYDIDRVINRTLVYALLTALLAGIYAGVVLVLGQLFGGIGETAPSWVVAAATLAVAALFQPARRRIQVVVDRRFTDASTTPPRRSRRSALGSAMRSIWTRSRPSCWRSWMRRCSRPRLRYGYGHRLRCHRGEDRQASQADPAMTPCMPCSFGLPRLRRSAGR